MWKRFKFKNIQFLIFSYSLQFYAYFMKLVWFSIFRSDAKQKFQWKFVFHTKGSPWQKMKWITKKCRSSPSEVFLGKDVLEICSKFTGEHPYQSVISIKLLCNFFEITFRHVLLLKGCFWKCSAKCAAKRSLRKISNNHWSTYSYTWTEYEKKIADRCSNKEVFLKKSQNSR